MSLFGGGSTKTKPIALTPGIHNVINSVSGELFRNRQPQQSGLVNQGVNQLNRLVGQGNPLIGAAGDLAQQTLQGGFLGPNPFLQSALEPAQQTFYDTIASIGSGAVNAGGSGRGVTQNLQGQAQERFADSLNRVAFNNYNNERQIQQNTLLNAGGLFNQQLLPGQTQIGLGQTLNQVDDRDFLRRLQVLQSVQGTPFGQSVKQPSNFLGTALGLGLTGAGLAFGGPAGGLVGSQLGGLFGGGGQAGSPILPLGSSQALPGSF